MRSSRYATFTDLFEGQHRTFRSAVCEAGCGHVARIRQATAKNLPDEMLSKKLVTWGWSLSPRLLCPRCREARKAPSRGGARALTPAQKRAAFCRIAGVPKATPMEERPVPADEPRTATPADRRAIRDALDAQYDEDKGCYRQAFSDKALAATLNVPTAWVTSLREANGLGPDRCEAQELRAAAMAAVEKKLDELETRILGDLDGLRADIKRLKVDSSYAGVG